MNEKVLEDIIQSKAMSHFSLPFMEDKVDLRKMYFSLLAEKWLIIVITCSMLVFGFLYAMTRVPQYQSRVLLQVKHTSGVGSLSSMMPAGILGKSNESADVQVALIKSPFILKEALESLGLDIVIQPRYFPFMGAWYARNHDKKLTTPFFGLHQYAWGGQQLQIASMKLAREMKDKKFKLIAGEHQDYQIFTPEGNLLATGKVGQLVKSDNKSEYHLELLISSLIANPGTEFFLTKKSMDKVADNMAAQLKITDLGNLYQLDKTGVLEMSLTGTNPQSVVDLLNAIAGTALVKDSEEKTMEAAKTLEFLKKQLPSVKASLNATEAALNAHRMKSGTIDLTIKSKLILMQLASVQKAIEQNNLVRIGALQRYTAKHPFIMALDNKKIALQAELNVLEKQLQTLPATDQVVVNLMRDVKVKSQLYLLLMRKMQELQVTQAGTVSDIRILNLASLPDAPLPAGRFVTILACGLAGFIFSALLILFRQSFRQRVEDPNWLEEHFGIPNFAILPFSKEQNENVKAYHDKTTKNLKLLAQTQPRDLAIEALRSLRTSLQFALIGAKNNIITIMGISPGVGKSFVSANFAYILADAGKRILLIDGDIRKGYLHDYFNKPRAPGLSEAISGAMSIKDIINKTSHTSLDFISSGKFPPNPSELLLSDQFKGFLDSVSAEYDLIVIDTAPILAVTDGVLIANHAAVNFLLIGGGR